MIATVDSLSVPWVDDIPWRELLGPAGLLAFITYSHLGREGTADPSHYLASAAHRHGLVLLDQMGPLDSPDHVRVDLLLFIQPLPVPARRLP
ncbi:hypothetical protein [Streptomyces sp. NPDC046909]|uniref:hypothetical protein n=1 Tax=Streptomyces sp. NPDC046909 TaxID=3155617 RepID=UPI0033EE2DCE